ncbi:hypothetical protein TrRE_jg178, partial [Triparma retinervis]
TPKSHAHVRSREIFQNTLAPLRNTKEQIRGVSRRIVLYTDPHLQP